MLVESAAGRAQDRRRSLFPAMSAAGLRYQPRTGATCTPLETRSGSHIYDGDPASFHDWEFRTLMRLKLYEDAVRVKSRPNGAPSGTAADSAGEALLQTNRPMTGMPMPPGEVRDSTPMSLASSNASSRRPSRTRCTISVLAWRA